MSGSLKPKLDWSDYASTPDDHMRYQIVNGDAIVTPNPSPQHQWVSKRLRRQIEDHFESRALGEVFAFVALILSDHDILEPDIVVVADKGQISERGIEGPPLVVVEVLSPITRDHDRGVKWRRYEMFGVHHYWMVDPDIRRLECHRLEGRAYRLVVEGQADAIVTHPDWSGLELDLGALWSGPDLAG